ncbi:Uncharacterised protein [Streptococcus gallolyticus]|uniref:Uncharacterized protein n=1 Tax=Streptococcus gallolyticus TaxID=315405 RepID=A0AA94M3V1_9STRE|nr:DUF6572 domain-containing protein [Streptococcus gallolyticus]AQP43169.1 hypothetical protein BTR42_11010 [Streptococcus gallolyticus subsp. gallolyticus DSM 16831]MCY7192630.1 hypothetical protein [Streptococcus gallolyticus subsp. gallolyticus]SQG80467.1 Uncharacterised protein [Streptococcus gallolyticus]
MDLVIEGIIVNLGMSYEEIPINKRSLFKITHFESDNMILLEPNQPILYKNRLFTVWMWFKNDKLTSITLDGRLGNPNFYEVHEEDKKWLLDNFGKPTEEKQWGVIYNFKEFQIIAEVDPRGMDAQITFRPRENHIYFDTTTIDTVGVVDGSLELLLIDDNLWNSDTEHDHLLKLQETINNYIYYLETKQYVEKHGDNFKEKVIHITFQYVPSDNGLAFLGQVQKILQPTDMSLKVTLPD